MPYVGAEAPARNPLTAIANCYIIIADCNETWRKASLSPAGRRNSSRPQPGGDATGNRTGIVQDIGEGDQPVLSVADRKRCPAPFDQLHADAACAVFQGASRLSGGRPGRLPDGVDLGS